MSPLNILCHNRKKYPLFVYTNNFTHSVCLYKTVRAFVCCFVIFVDNNEDTCNTNADDDYLWDCGSHVKFFCEMVLFDVCMYAYAFS